MLRGTESGRRHTGVCNSSRMPSLGVVGQKYWEVVGVATAALTAQLPGLGWTQPMHWRTEVAEAAVAGPGHLGPGLLVAELSLQTVLVWEDFLDLKVLDMWLGALVGEKSVAEAPALAEHFLSHTGPVHLLLPAGRNGLGYVARGQIVWEGWQDFAEKLGHLDGTGHTFSQDFLKFYLT